MQAHQGNAAAKGG